MAASTTALSSTNDERVRDKEEFDRNKIVFGKELHGLKTQLSENGVSNDARIAELSDLKENLHQLQASKETAKRSIEEQSKTWKSKESELTANAAEYEKRVSKLATELCDAEAQISMLKTRLHELEILKSSAEVSGAEQSDLAHAQSVQLEGLRSRLNSLEQSLAVKETEAQVLTTRLSGTDDAAEGYRAALVAQEASFTELLSETTDKFEAEAVKRVVESETQMQKANSEKDEVLQSNEKLHIHLEELQTQLAVMVSEREEHEAAKEKARLLAETIEGTGKHREEALSSKVEELQTQLAVMVSEREEHEAAKEKARVLAETIEGTGKHREEALSSKVEELQTQLAVMASEREEQEKFKERTKGSVATMLEKLKHFKSIADEKSAEVSVLSAAMESGNVEIATAHSKIEVLNEEVIALQVQLKNSEKIMLEAQDKAIRLESETAGMMRMAQEGDAKSEAERQRLHEEKQKESTLRDSDLEGLRSELVSAQRSMEEREGRIKVFEETLSSYTTLIAEKGEEIDELKRYLHDLKGQLEVAEAKTIRAESETSIAVVDLTALSERYVQAQEARTVTDSTAAEHAAEAVRAVNDLKEATSAIEDRDAQLSSYADHVEMLERSLKKEHSSVAQLQSEYENVSAELQGVSNEFMCVQYCMHLILNAHAG